MYVVYSNYEEVIVTTLENEHKTIKEYFTEGGRDPEEYDREGMTQAAVAITPRFSIR